MDEVVNSNNVRMRQFQAALCLVFKLIQQRTILNHQVRKKFQRNIALQFFVPCQPNDSHSASAEHLHQRITTKHNLAVGSVERSLEKATGAASLGRVSWDFGSAVSANSDRPTHGCCVGRPLGELDSCRNGSACGCHTGRIFTVRMEKKLKARSGGAKGSVGQLSVGGWSR